MLRKGLIQPQRNHSVCAFCQLRLFSPRTKIPHRRLFSSTKPSLENGGDAQSSSGSTVTAPHTNTTAQPPSTRGFGSGWGKPLFATSIGPAGKAEGSRDHLDSTSIPQGRPSSNDGLLPHEIEARKRFNARLAQSEQQSLQHPAGFSGPGRPPKYIWNAEKQKEIMQNIDNNSRASRTRSTEPISRSQHTSPLTRTDVASTTPNPAPRSHRHRLDHRHNRGDATPRPLPFKGLDSNEPLAPHRSREDRGTLSQIGTRNNRDVSPTSSPVQARRRDLGDNQAFVRVFNSQDASGKQDERISRRQQDRVRGDSRKTQDHEMTETTTMGLSSGRPRGPAETSQFAASSSDSASDPVGAWASLTRKKSAEKGTGDDFFTELEKEASSKPKAAAPASDWGREFDNIVVRQPRAELTSTPTGRRKTPEVKHSVPSNTAADWQLESPREVWSDSTETSSRSRRQGMTEKFEISRGKDKKGGKTRPQRSTRYDEYEDEDMDDSYEEYMERRQMRAERKAQREAERTGPRPITIPEFISISHLAEALSVGKNGFLSELAELGFEDVSLDSIMAGETAALVAQEYGFEPTLESGEFHDLKPRALPEDPSILPPRPPVVTIMGHVDHGKTTLLDYLRKSSVAAQEHGGITQHIGAFSVKLSGGKQITFLDTPGHAAFLTMRQRGANVTDIVVLVVAADDSVKPQTLEALKHAQAAKVPIIVAINKIDKDGARVEQVRGDLARNGVEIEDYGGDVQVVCVSGKTGQGMEDLEESILTLSEILDMRAEDDGPAEGWILESSLKPIGKTATILVKRGTLRPGDFIAAGTTWAKIRHLRNEAGVEVDEAPPGTPVEILGWRDLPAAGDQVLQAPDERRCRAAAEYRESLREREKDALDHEKILEQRKAAQQQRRDEKATEGNKWKRADGNWGIIEQSQGSDAEAGGTKVVNFMVKGDVHGSVEAVCACIQEIGSHEVRPRILRSGAGQINESDVEHATTSGAHLVNFNLSVPGHIKRMAEDAGVKILEHTIIYHLADDVTKTLSSYLEAEVSFKVLGEAEVLQIFPINLRGRTYKNIAGCRIRNGKVDKNDLFKVLRRGEVLYEGKLESLKHGKKDVTDARKGGECGIGFEDFQDLQVGDTIQALEEVTTQRTL